VEDFNRMGGCCSIQLSLGDCCRQHTQQSSLSKQKPSAAEWVGVVQVVAQRCACPVASL